MFREKSSFWYSATALTIAVFVLFMAGCDSSSPSSDDDDVAGTTVAVTATPGSIATGSYSVVEATVESAGSGIAGQEVVFTVLPAGAGTCSPVIDTTDGDGVVATMFTPSATGSVSITATVSGTSTTGTAWVTVTQSGQTGTGNVSMTVSPSLLFATGDDTARVTVVVTDANGDPAPDSTLVKICAGEKFVDLDGNGYWSTGIDSLVYDNNANDLWDAVGNIPSTAYTSGGNGTAAVDFVSGTKAGTYYIKATVDEGGISDAAEQSVQLNPATEMYSIFLAAELMNIVVSQTGGIETAELYATGYDINGNAVPEGIAISFTILDGPDGGEFVGDDPDVDVAVAFTNSQGVASVPIHAGFVAGTIRIRAYANTVLSNATQIMVSAGPPKYIVMGAGNQCNYQYWTAVNSRVGVVAVVSDTFLNPVNDSTVVYFSCDEGTMISHEARTQDLEGVAYSEWISGNNVETADGDVWVFAETAGGTVQCSTMFYNSSPLVTSWMVPNTISMYADGKSKRAATVYGLDINANPVVGGTSITFKTDEYINVTSAILQDGCVESSDVVEISSAQNLDYDYSMPGGDDDGIGGTYYISGDLGPWGGGLFSMCTVTLLTGNSYYDNCEIKCEENVGQGVNIMVGAVIQDRWGNPLGDHTLVMTVSGGTEVVDTQDTDGYGEASGFIFTTPGFAGQVTITIEDTDPRGGIFLTTTVTVE